MATSKEMIKDIQLLFLVRWLFFFAEKEKTIQCQESNEKNHVKRSPCGILLLVLCWS